jgi:hypothetical protein
MRQGQGCGGGIYDQHSYLFFPPYDHQYHQHQQHHQLHSQQNLDCRIYRIEGDGGGDGSLIE